MAPRDTTESQDPIITQSVLRPPAALALVALATIVAGCGGGGDSSSSGTNQPLDATFTNVYANTVNPTNCGGPACHLLASTTGFAIGAKSALYPDLVNKPASGPKCGPAKTGDAGDGGVLIRVVPGQPDQSLLYLKLSHAAPCGDDMPVGLPLPDTKVDLVKRWILAGAKND